MDLSVRNGSMNVDITRDATLTRERWTFHARTEGDQWVLVLNTYERWTRPTTRHQFGTKAGTHAIYMRLTRHDSTITVSSLVPLPEDVVGEMRTQLAARLMAADVRLTW